ncbi:MAG: class I SAM-dependent methyltransferase [Bacteriovoracales bacterium]|nr:class I SAM-dependent methyltransferase [Bacteriovoracales bacterium]
MHPVSSTSSLVLLWTDKSNYKTPSSQRFWDKLDLDAGRPLDKKIEAKLPEFRKLSVTQINNRKYGIRKFSSEFLKTHPDAQVVCLGAGLDPKSLDTAEDHPGALVFDVDMENMELKEKMTREVQGPNNLKFCTANVGKPQELISSLKAKGWNPEKTTFVIAEGISYYISKEQFKDALFALKTPGGAAIIEYAIPDEDVVAENKELITVFFNLLQDMLNWPTPLERYSLQEASDLAQELGARIETLESLEMEKGRGFVSDIPPGPLCVSYLTYP